MTTSCDLSAPVFSVIIPTRGRGHLLTEAIGSVLSQTLKFIEVVVVDDAGPTPVRTPRDPRIRLLRKDSNAGAAAARNAGILAARGTYVAFLDDDDLWLPHRLEIAWHYHAEADVVVIGNSTADGRLAPTRNLQGDVSRRILDQITPHLGQTSVLRAKIPLFNPAYRGAEDVEWWLRVALAERVTTVREPGFWYRVHEGVRHGNGLEARIEGSLLLLAHHEGYFAAHPRAHAFRYYRLGALYHRSGDLRAARSALLKALRYHPTPRSALTLARTLR